jgi:hypothetical protein
MSLQFWINEPTILLNKDYIFELWPTPNMIYNQKLNAITRLVLFLTLLGFAVTMSFKILFIGIATIAAIFALYKIQKQKITPQILSEGFTDKNTMNMNTIYNTTTNPVTLESALKTDFKMGNKKNPFSNVLLTEIYDEPERKAAPPSFNYDVDEDIVKNTKKMVQQLNPTIKNTDKQLFSDLYNNFELDQSNRVFYSTANTRVANDQSSFANFLYGDMPSAKESGVAGNMQREKNNYRYTLY